MGMNLVMVTKEPREKEKRRFKRKGKPIGEVGLEVEEGIWNYESTMSTVPVGREAIQAGSKSPDICHLEPSRYRASSPLKTACTAPSHTACWGQSRGPAGLLLPWGWLPAASP